MLLGPYGKAVLPLNEGVGKFISFENLNYSILILSVFIFAFWAI